MRKLTESQRQAMNHTMARTPPKRSGARAMAMAREKIAADTREFLAAGGEIKRCDTTRNR